MQTAANRVAYESPLPASPMTTHAALMRRGNSEAKTSLITSEGHREGGRGRGAHPQVSQRAPGVQAASGPRWRPARISVKGQLGTFQALPATLSERPSTCHSRKLRGNSHLAGMTASRSAFSYMNSEITNFTCFSRVTKS